MVFFQSTVKKAEAWGENLKRISQVVTILIKKYDGGHATIYTNDVADAIAFQTCIRRSFFPLPFLGRN